jgi:hypothetical protein
MSLGKMPPVESRFCLSWPAQLDTFIAERTFMLPPSPRAVFLSVVCALFLASPAAAQTKLLRFADIHGDRVAFT